MNYANMIEEKHLKKGFIIATLMSTIIGTFTTSINLYERVRDRHNQHKTDHNQDEKIKSLERRADDADKARRRAEKEKYEHAMAQLNQNNGGGNDNRQNGPNGVSSQKGTGLGRPQNDLRDALAASGPLIRREYDHNYARLGPRFAEGDQIAQNELQAQIIDLQASVIRLLQDALVTGTMPDPAVLYAAAGRARTGSIRALQDQYQRMLAAAPISRTGPRSSSVASAAARRSYAGGGGVDDYDRRGSWDDRDLGRRSQSQTGRRAATFPLQLPPPLLQQQQPPLFCRYAIQLQQDGRRTLDVGGGDGSSTAHSKSHSNSHSSGDDDDLICPACTGKFAIEHDRSWKMHKPVVVGERVEEVVNRGDKPGSRDGHDEDDDRLDDAGSGKLVTTRRKNIIELVQDRQFVLSNRFIVKCHRPAAYDAVDNTLLLPPTYACCLCDRFDGGRVALCGSMTRLVNHVCEAHSVGELISDPDIRELRAPPPPRR